VAKTRRRTFRAVNIAVASTASTLQAEREASRQKIDASTGELEGLLEALVSNCWYRAIDQTWRERLPFLKPWRQFSDFLADFCNAPSADFALFRSELALVWVPDNVLETAPADARLRALPTLYALARRDCAELRLGETRRHSSRGAMAPLPRNEVGHQPCEDDAGETGFHIERVRERLRRIDGSQTKTNPHPSRRSPFGRSHRSRQRRKPN
jgi:hypothetical protein